MLHPFKVFSKILELTIEKVKTFSCPLSGCRPGPRNACSGAASCFKKAEPTAQQDETPQPPPENPREEDRSWLLPESVEQQKDDMTFFTSFDEHFGQFVEDGQLPTRWSRENRSPHFVQIYS
ncbi:MAG: hypothetical protein OHK006_21600 [Thermodesulfovibrionales bacterium]